MCGIGAVINLGLSGDELFNIVTTLLKQLESRGRDATGIFMVFEDGSFFIRKVPIKASEFIKYLQHVKDKLKLSEVLYVTLHTRYATSGSPMDNENNHPLYEIVNDDLITVVHNGIISHCLNSELAKFKKREVDSDYLLTGVRRYGRYDVDVVKETLKYLHGSIACIYANLKGLIMWYRNTSPLSQLTCKKAIILASEEKMLKHIDTEFNLHGEIKEVPRDKLHVLKYNNFKISTENVETDKSLAKLKKKKKRKVWNEDWEIDDDDVDRLLRKTLFRNYIGEFLDY